MTRSNNEPRPATVVKPRRECGIYHDRGITKCGWLRPQDHVEVGMAEVDCESSDDNCHYEIIEGTRPVTRRGGNRRSSEKTRRENEEEQVN
jgi:hypothetical protein